MDARQEKLSTKEKNQERTRSTMQNQNDLKPIDLDELNLASISAWVTNHADHLVTEIVGGSTYVGELIVQSEGRLVAIRRKS